MINLKELLGLNFYTSELDQFIAEFDKKHPKLSASQRAERQKYARIYKLRDDPTQSLHQENFWDNF